jgi:K+-transporting ATPase KdpF subunit
MLALYWLAGLISFALLGYLLVALLAPETFQ